MVFGRLFRRPVTRERAVALAAEFLAANGCRVVASAAEADYRITWAGLYA